MTDADIAVLLFLLKFYLLSALVLIIAYRRGTVISCDFVGKLLEPSTSKLVEK